MIEAMTSASEIRPLSETKENREQFPFFFLSLSFPNPEKVICNCQSREKLTSNSWFFVFLEIVVDKSQHQGGL